MHEQVKLPFFNLKEFLNVIECYVQSDEVERALWLLDNLPGAFRDFPPPELVALKKDILAAMITPHGYLTSGCDSDVGTFEQSSKSVLSFLRGILILKEVERYNTRGLKPHIVDVGPGEYFIPLGLKHLNCDFTYYDIAMDPNTGQVAHPLIHDKRQAKPDNQPTIFVALEIIEHLPATRDLVIEAQRHCQGWPDRIHLSTPCYTYDAAVKNWRRPTGLPHLRTYTPMEFLSEASKLFPGYSWEIYNHTVMSLRGCRNDKLDKALMTENDFKGAL